MHYLDLPQIVGDMCESVESIHGAQSVESRRCPRFLEGAVLQRRGLTTETQDVNLKSR